MINQITLFGGSSFAVMLATTATTCTTCTTIMMKWSYASELNKAIYFSAVAVRSSVATTSSLTLLTTSLPGVSNCSGVVDIIIIDAKWNQQWYSYSYLFRTFSFVLVVFIIINFLDKINNNNDDKYFYVANEIFYFIKRVGMKISIITTTTIINNKNNDNNNVINIVYC